MTRSTLRHRISAAAVALLAACQQPAPAPMAPPPVDIQPGYLFLLSSPLAFPPDNPELLFQNLQIVTAGSLSPDMPYCRLRPERGAPGAIAPGSLTVVAVTYDERGSGTAGGMASVTRVALSTAAGGPGYLLACGWPAGASYQGFLTAQQIFNAIGGKFSMGPPL